MPAFLIFAAPIVVLAGFCWIVSVARPTLRVFALIAATGLFSYVAFTLGTIVERGFFDSSHIHWFAKYSAYLHQLADQHDCEKLSRVVTRFDQRFSPRPQDADNLQDTMYELFEMGPYYQQPK